MRLEFDTDRAVPFLVFVAMERRGLAYVDGLEVLATEQGKEWARELRELNDFSDEDDRHDSDESILAAAIWQMSKEAFGSVDAAIESLILTVGPDGRGRYPRRDPEFAKHVHEPLVVPPISSLGK